MDWRFLQELEKVPDRYADEAFVVLRQRTKEGAKRRFCRLNDRVKNRLDNEFEMIRATNTGKLFLYWADTVALIKQRTYPYICSVQNCSLVSYCLGITEVNPLLTGSYFERLLNRQSAHVPILFIEVPKGKREKILEHLEEKSFIEIEENAARADLSAKDVSAFFERQTYKGKEILRRAAASLEFEGRIKSPEKIRELAELLVYKRYTEFMEDIKYINIIKSNNVTKSFKQLFEDLDEYKNELYSSKSVVNFRSKDINDDTIKKIEEIFKEEFKDE